MVKSSFVLVIVIAILGFIVFLLNYVKSNNLLNMTGVVELGSEKIPVSEIIGVDITNFTYIAFVVCAIAVFILWVNRKHHKNSVKNNEKYNINTFRKNQAELKAEVDFTKNALKSNDYRLSATLNKQKQIYANLQEANSTLQEMYALDILPLKYRSFSAVATLYGYLETGRCDIIKGHGGIYDTYEKDLQAGIIISTLTEIRDSMQRMEVYQQILVGELQTANNYLYSIDSSLKMVDKNIDEIRKDTAISTIAQQQTASATQYLARYQTYHS